MKSVFYSNIFLISIALLLILYGVTPDLFFAVCFLAASLMIKESADWARGKCSIFDPAAFVSIISYVYFFISPVLQRHWEYWLGFPSLESNDGWLEFWAFLNLAGASIYRASLTFFMRKRTPQIKEIYTFNRKRFYLLTIIFGVIGLASQTYIYMSFGGISGFLNTFSERQSLGANNYDPFQGFGVPMLLADGFRNVFALFLIVHFKGSKISKKWWFFLICIISMILVNVIFGGLKGSRGAIIYSLFWGVGMYHFWIREIKIKHALVGIAVLFAFMNTYYWYKFAGVDGISAAWDPSARQELNQGARTENIKFVISRDFGRMDFQSVALKEIFDGDFELAFGRTYLSAVFTVIPSFIVSPESKPPSITKEKTELIFGKGSYIHGEPRETTTLLGQLGEMTVNFGIFGFILFFLLLSAYSLKISSFLKGLNSEDVRTLLIPMLSLLSIQLFMYDSSVMSQFLLRNFIYISIIYIYCTKRTTLHNLALRRP